MEIETSDEVRKNETYHFDVKRYGNHAEVRINGVKIPIRKKLPTFLPGTNLFIGGVPSGITVNSRIGGAASFKGCISKVIHVVHFSHYIFLSWKVLFLTLFFFQKIKFRFSFHHIKLK